MKAATTLLVLCVAGLCALGLVILSSASVGQTHARYLLMQPVWFSVALVVCACAALFDYRWLKPISWAIFAVAVVALILVLVPGIGKLANGARRWFEFGGMHAQPSEFAKLALVIGLAHYCELAGSRMQTFRRGTLIPVVLIAAVAGLVFLEPDWGTSMLLGAVSGMMVLVAGARWRHLLPIAAAGVAGLGLALLQNPVRIARILAWLNPAAHSEGNGYQVSQSIAALGSGGWFGRGLGNARHKLGFLPEHPTDFILAVVGEELGLVATLAVVVAFMLIVFCGLYIAWNARDRFGLYLGCGLTFLIGLQAFINIGVVTGVLPNKGLSLPFISYGGSNLVVMCAAVGILLSIAQRAGSPVAPRLLRRKDPFSASGSSGMESATS